jgi:hypothetical protein
MNSGGPCRICSQPTVGADAVQLWDGRRYCRNCVESVSPELYRYAKTYDRLEELAPIDKADLWRRAWRGEALVILPFAVLFGAAGYNSFGAVGILYGLVSVGFVAALQSALQLPMFVRYTESRLPTVSVSDGLVTVHRGVRKIELQCTRPLHDFRWRLGRSRQDSHLRGTMVPRRSVVLLVIPATGWLSFGTVRIACGWTDESQRIWTAFLTLAGVATDSRTAPPKPQ